MTEEKYFEYQKYAMDKILSGENKEYWFKRYRPWDIVDAMPEGWRVDGDTHSCPVVNSVFITECKSPLFGAKRAILRVKREARTQPTPTQIQPTLQPAKPKEKQKESPFPAKEFNNLARKRMQQRLLADILVDMQICSLEGWRANEYLSELKMLINSTGTRKKQGELPKILEQLSLF